MLKGTFTALITPFKRDGSFDRAAYKKIIEQQIAAGIEGLVAVGTTGESPTVTHDENIEIIDECVKIADGRTKVIAGTGSNSTSEAEYMTRRAAELGADYSLLVCPYYNKPSQEGLYRHFKQIAEAVPQMQHILYNVPGRTGASIAPETVIRLAEIPNIVALKDATGKTEDIDALNERLPAYFSILSGDDDMTIELMKKGASGVISVASNLRPATVKAMVDAVLENRLDDAERIFTEISPLFRACFAESNPLPIKTLMAMEGRCEEVFRLPLCEVSPKTRALLKGFV